MMQPEEIKCPIILLTAALLSNVFKDIKDDSNMWLLAYMGSCMASHLSVCMLASVSVFEVSIHSLPYDQQIATFTMMYI